MLSIAVGTRRVGYVFIGDGQLCDWGITIKSAKSKSDIAVFVQGLISELQPDVVVSEKCDRACRKGNRTRALIGTIAEIASHNTVLDVSIPRPRRYKSKFEEATFLAEKYPEIAGYLPTRKRRFFEFEPRSMMLFEALALAEEAMQGPPTRLVAAMG